MKPSFHIAVEDFFRLPAKVWAPILRVAWLFGYKSNSESLTDVKQRAEFGAEMLTKLPKADKRALFVEYV